MAGLRVEWARPVLDGMVGTGDERRATAIARNPGGSFLVGAENRHDGALRAYLFRVNAAGMREATLRDVRGGSLRAAVSDGGDGFYVTSAEGADQRARLARVGPDGSERWSIDPEAVREFAGAAVDRDGTVYTAGIARVTSGERVDFRGAALVFDAPYAGSGLALFVAAFDAGARCRWVTGFPLAAHGSAEVVPPRVTIDAEGGVYVAGVAQLRPNGGGVPSRDVGGNVLLGLARTGAPRWVVSFGGGGLPVDGIAARDRRVLVVGACGGGDSFTFGGETVRCRNDEGGTGSYFVASFDAASGTLAGARVFEGPSAGASARAMASAPDGSLALIRVGGIVTRIDPGSLETWNEYLAFFDRRFLELGASVTSGDRFWVTGTFVDSLPEVDSDQSFRSRNRHYFVARARLGRP